MLVAALVPAIAAAEPVQQAEPPAKKAPPADKAKLAGEFSGKMTIDPKPGGKHFQGVWVQRDGASMPKPGELDRDRLLVDYRARELWRSFEGERVLARGTCYHPFGQAIRATHFEIDRLKFAGTPPASARLLEIGPYAVMSGELVAHAGGKDLVFRSGSITYAIAGDSSGSKLAAGPAKLGVRTVAVNPKVVSTTSKDHVWILNVHRLDFVPDSGFQNEYYLCK
jgi:hypothetical protein